MPPAVKFEDASSEGGAETSSSHRPSLTPIIMENAFAAADLFPRAPLKQTVIPWFTTTATRDSSFSGRHTPLVCYRPGL